MGFQEGKCITLIKYFPLQIIKKMSMMDWVFQT